MSNHLFLSRNFINEIPIDQNNGYYLLLNDVLLYVWDIFKSRDKNEYRLKFIELQVIEICIGLESYLTLMKTQIARNLINFN